MFLLGNVEVGNSFKFKKSTQTRNTKDVYMRVISKTTEIYIPPIGVSVVNKNTGELSIRPFSTQVTNVSKEVFS